MLQKKGGGGGGEVSLLRRGDDMRKKEMIAMLLAGGQGSRLGVLTAKVAKPAVAFGGKYRIIDFPLSNCINSGIDTVGVLTQYQPLRLNAHIGIGIPWDLDRNYGGVTVLPPYERSGSSEWYSGTANAIYQNLDYMEQFDPDYVLILSGDHIYKMDYEVMLDYHKANNADITIAAMPVPIEEASRFGVMITDGNGRNTAFEEKPENKYALFVYLKKTGEAIGFAGMRELERGIYEETGIALGPEFVRKGYGRQILTALLEEAGKLGAKEFHACYRTGNAASRALQLSCGFVFDSLSEEKTDPRTGETYVLENHIYRY